MWHCCSHYIYMYTVFHFVVECIFVVKFIIITTFIPVKCRLLLALPNVEKFVCFSASVIIAFAFSSCLTLYSIVQILTNYRKNIKLMYKGLYQHLPFRVDDKRPNFILVCALFYYLQLLPLIV